MYAAQENEGCSKSCCVINAVDLLLNYLVVPNNLQCSSMGVLPRILYKTPCHT